MMRARSEDSCEIFVYLFDDIGDVDLRARAPGPNHVAGSKRGRSIWQQLGAHRVPLVEHSGSAQSALINRKQRRAAAKFGQTSSHPPGEVAAAAVAAPGAAELLATGLTHQQAGRLAEAEACYRRVLAAQPDHADALHLLGVIAHQVGRHDLAVEWIGQAIKRDARNPVYFSNLGVALKAQGKLDEVVAACRQAIHLKPDYAEAYSNLGYALWDQGRLDEAVAACRQAIRFKPELAEAHCNLGGALEAQGKHDEAVAACHQAIRLRPDYAEAFYNRGNALKELKRLDEALASYDKALALKPDYAEAHWNEFLAQAADRRFRARLGRERMAMEQRCIGPVEAQFHAAALARCRARSTAGRCCCTSEQGLGDAIQFCRYVPLLAARGARVIVEVEEPLRQLMSGLAGVSRCVSKGEALPDFDLHCPLLSLPLAFGTRLETIPSTTPYLRAPAHGQELGSAAWAERSTRIGLVWSGNPRHRNDRKRSIELERACRRCSMSRRHLSACKRISAPAMKPCWRSDSDIIQSWPIACKTSPTPRR